MKHWNFEGVDISLEISLFEYGFVCAENKADADFFVLFKVDEDQFDFGFIKESELDSLINGHGWMSSKDIESFLDRNGTTKEIWLANSFVYKLGDILSYYGYQNIFGTSSSVFSRKQVEKMLSNQAT
jgi:hypothetical protein